MTTTEWVIAAVPAEPPVITDATRTHPLATQSGIWMLNQILIASDAWKRLTKPQRELLLSACAGYPVQARADVKARMVARGLIEDDLQPTSAGRLIVKWRTP